LSSIEWFGANSTGERRSGHGAWVLSLGRWQEDGVENCGDRERIVGAVTMKADGL